MLRFEEWIETQKISEYAKKLFQESIMCYKVGAFRASFIVTFTGFTIILKERVLSRKNSPPEYIKEKKWRGLIETIENPDKWENELLNSIQDKSEESFFRLSENVRCNVAKWRGTRNQIVHGVATEVSAIEVKYFWEFIENNINKFYIGGGKEYITKEILYSLDIRKTELLDSYIEVVNQIPEIMNQDEIINLFYIVTEEIKNLGDYAIKENEELFWKYVIDIPYLKKCLIEFIKKHNNVFLSFYNKFSLLGEEILQDKIFRKEYWHEYVLKHRKRNVMDIFNIYIKEKCLVSEEITLFFKYLIENDRLYTVKEYILRDEGNYSILKVYGFFRLFLEKVNNINFRSFYQANDNEAKLHFAIEYCEVNQELYEEIIYVLSKRTGGSLVNGIKKLLNVQEIKEKYIDYQNKKGINDLTQYLNIE
ncbi:MAG: hypothetical protein AB9856_10585 [Cellulosilyticaceae bacterium]